MTVQTIALSAIRADTKAQPRTSMFMEKIEEYQERMAEGDVFPPLVVFQEGNTYWLADGFHRFHAAQGLEFADFACDVHETLNNETGLRAAVLFSCGVNAAHGIQRTNEDKRRAVLKLLDDPEWAGWNDSKIARACRVNHKTVAALRERYLGNSQDTPRKVERGGATYTMNTANIGGSRPLSAGREERTWSPSDVPARPTEAQRIAALGASPDRAEQIARDNANAFISSGLWEIERQMQTLPSPQEAVRRFPTHHHHTLNSQKLQAMARWLSAFAAAWAETVEGETHVAAE